MRDSEDLQGADVRTGAVGDVRADKVIVHQGGARSVQAARVDIRQSGAVHVQAHEVEVYQGGIGVAQAQSVHVSEGSIGVLVAGEVEGHNVRVLMTPLSALAFGAAAGVTLWLLGRWSRA
jgi:hypothetical protein